MKRTELKPRTKPLKRTPLKRVAVLAGSRARANGIGVPKRKAVSTCTPAQRAKVKATGCIVTGDRENVDPAHLIPCGVSGVGQDDDLAVVGLRRDLHRQYDTGELDILPYLEPAYRAELAFAVMRVGLVATYRRVTNTREVPNV